MPYRAWMLRLSLTVLPVIALLEGRRAGVALAVSRANHHSEGCRGVPGGCNTSFVLAKCPGAAPAGQGVATCSTESEHAFSW